MKNICHKEKCTGCGLCVAQCPKNCITLRKGFLGHLYPHIDQRQCVDCGLCQTRCPANHTPQLNKADVAYAAFAKDQQEYTSSTSGGAAAVLSRLTIRNGGVVYGCAVTNIDAKTLDVKHVRIETKSELYRLKGSKYVQSRIVDIIPSLKKDVKAGREVLFVGTPCQVAAIRNIYQKHGTPDNLTLVDLVCHGVPSLAMLQQHIKRKAKGSDVDDIRFRDGNGMYLLLLQGREVYKMPLWERRYKDTYFNTFIDGYTYRHSCHQCDYARPERVSDITIGDFWGLGEETSTSDIPDHPNGISLILPNTEKGQACVQRLDSLMHLHKRSVTEAVNGNTQLREPKRADIRIRIFQHLQPLLGTAVAYRLCEIEKVSRQWRIDAKIGTRIKQAFRKNS